MLSHICASTKGIPTVYKVLLPVLLTYPYSPYSAEALGLQGNLPTQPDRTGIPSLGLALHFGQTSIKAVILYLSNSCLQLDCELPEGRSFDILSLLSSPTNVADRKHSIKVLKE